MTQNIKPRAAANRAAMDNPTKKPRIVHVDIVFDDEAAEAHELALKALQAAETRLLDSQARRVASVRAAFTADVSPEEQAQALAQVLAADQLELDPLREDVRQAELALEAGIRRYKFRGLGRSAWEALKARHPATEEDHQATREASGNKDDIAGYSFKSLAPELVELASVSPKLSAEDVVDIFEGELWNDPEIAALYQAALMAQISARSNPLARR